MSQAEWYLGSKHKGYDESENTIADLEIGIDKRFVSSKVGKYKLVTLRRVRVEAWWEAPKAGCFTKTDNENLNLMIRTGQVLMLGMLHKTT